MCGYPTWIRCPTSVFRDVRPRSEECLSGFVEEECMVPSGKTLQFEVDRNARKRPPRKTYAVAPARSALHATDSRDL